MQNNKDNLKVPVRFWAGIAWILLFYAVCMLGGAFISGCSGGSHSAAAVPLTDYAAACPKGYSGTPQSGCVAPQPPPLPPPVITICAAGQSTITCVCDSPMQIVNFICEASPTQQSPSPPITIFPTGGGPTCPSGDVLVNNECSPSIPPPNSPPPSNPPPSNNPPPAPPPPTLSWVSPPTITPPSETSAQAFIAPVLTWNVQASDSADTAAIVCTDSFDNQSYGFNGLVPLYSAPPLLSMALNVNVVCGLNSSASIPAQASFAYTSNVDTFTASPDGSGGYLLSWIGYGALDNGSAACQGAPVTSYWIVQAGTANPVGTSTNPGQLSAATDVQPGSYTLVCSTGGPPIIDVGAAPNGATWVLH